ncbi:MAG: riboflavin biosynthesis protein RibF [Clostridia bacterium]|nr:riboflavin biosynthesis protein RibF [Clostridia bacterium]
MCFIKTVKYSGECPLLCRAGCVVALGLFDGVHIAHRALITEARKRADELGLPLAVFTFPSESPSLKGGKGRLYSTEERLSLLEELSVDVTVLCDFDSIRDTSPEDFADTVLVRNLGARLAVYGYNFTYGKGGVGNAVSLKERLAHFGVGSFVLDEKRYFGEEISTTRIKGLLDALDLMGAARLLGKAYFITGTVVKGRGDGKGLGIPTVNLDLKDDLYALPHGVYATAVVIDGVPYLSMTNIGTCPTFGARQPHAECCILGYDGDLYGEKMYVYFIKRLRDEMYFDNADKLIMQINIDKNEVLSLESEKLWQELGLK